MMLWYNQSLNHNWILAKMILVKLFEYQKTDQIEAQNVDIFRSVSSSLLTIDLFSLKIFVESFNLYQILAEVLSVIMTWLSSGGCAFFPIMGLSKK